MGEMEGSESEFLASPALTACLFFSSLVDR